MSRQSKYKYTYYESNLLRIIEVTRKFSSRYTRSKVRKIYEHSNLSYIIDELLKISPTAILSVAIKPPL